MVLQSPKASALEQSQESKFAIAQGNEDSAKGKQWQGNPPATASQL